MSTAFTGAHLITGDGRDYDDANGVVQDGRAIRDDLGLMDELQADRRGAAAAALA